MKLRGLGRIPDHVVPYDLQRWPEAIPRYGCGHIARVRDFLRTAQGKQGLFLCGDYLNAPGPREPAAREGLWQGPWPGSGWPGEQKYGPGFRPYL
ncbi:MAG: hypothetical protein HY319_31760 [Armatimonadetes bacterium]|nr:hypothetical protein [Armatimonadota bacterium]